MANDVTQEFDAPAIAPLLEVRGGGKKTALYDLKDTTLVIGRVPECDVFLDSPRVSRRHAELNPESAGRWRIRDLGSRNGTHVNGQVVTEQHIGPGDLVQIGDFELRILIPSPTHADMDMLPTKFWSDTHESEPARFTDLASSPSVKLNAVHLAKVGSLSSSLAEIPESSERMAFLCRTLVTPELHCTSAVVLNTSRAGTQTPPVLLCPFQLAPGMGTHPVSRTLVEAAIERQQPVLAGGIVSSGLTVSLDEEERGVTACIACPLRIDNTQADVLYVTVPHQLGSVDWLALVALAAEQLKKADLQIEARQRTHEDAEMQYDIQKAKQIQMSLVPKNPQAKGLEIAIGFEPCRFVGGDYVNVLTAADGRTFLTIADVSGHGLSAAMLATGVHSIVHASIRTGVKLPDMAQSLNRFLLDSLDLQSFVTLYGMMYDGATGRAECLNAGHPPPVIVQADGKVRELAIGRNPPLGVVLTEMQTDPLELALGDTLVLFTDGLSELWDPGHNMLGVEGVMARLAELYRAAPQAPLTELRDKLNEMLNVYRGDSPATDDRTFLMARRAI